MNQATCLYLAWCTGSGRKCRATNTDEEILASKDFPRDQIAGPVIATFRGEVRRRARFLASASYRTRHLAVVHVEAKGPSAREDDEWSFAKSL